MQVPDLVTVEGVGVTRAQLINAAGSLERRDEFIVAGPGTAQHALNGVVPAIAIPAEPKAGFVGPGSHIRALTELLPEVYRILCIVRDPSSHHRRWIDRRMPTYPIALLRIRGSLPAQLPSGR